MAHRWTRHVNTSWHTYEEVITHVLPMAASQSWHGTRVKESWKIYEYSMQMSHGARMNKSLNVWMSQWTYETSTVNAYLAMLSLQTCKWVMAHIWIRHVDESWRTYEWVICGWVIQQMKCLWSITIPQYWCMQTASHTYLANLTRHTCEWVMAHTWIRHVDE